MYQVIARKYRPQSFSELIGQEHVKTTLENAISQRRIAHGYILAGQRGTGKTTVARILARCLNCVEGPTTHPCGKCASCLEIATGHAPDVIEIDAASNRGINEMRELRENVRYRPARDRYKVFIIDEAHQITNEAFNALLKTLEEPPEWVVFVLCTTEVHKIPTTIGSRCQQFSFRSVDFAELTARMQWICDQEGITADAEALAVLAQAGEGSVRDSLSALDQAIACSGAELKGEDVRGLLGLFSIEALERVANALAASDSAAMLEIVGELERTGQNLQHYCREMARFFRNLLVAKIAGPNTRLIAASIREQERMVDIAAKFSEDDLTRYLQIALGIFSDLQTSLQPRFHLEIGLLRLVHAGRMTGIEEALAQLGPAAGTPLASTPKPPQAQAPKVAPPPPVRTGPSHLERDAMRKAAPPAASTAVAAAPPPPPAPAPAAPPAAHAAAVPAPAPEQGQGDIRQRLHALLVERGQIFSADAVEHSVIVEAGSEWRFTTASEFKLAVKSPEVEAAARELTGRPIKIVVQVGQATAVPAAPKPANEDEATQRALAHPEVKRFQDIFPNSHVRTVRNLKES